MVKMNEHIDNLKKNLIIETASKYFKEFGYEKTQIDKISKELGIGVGTIYSYFQSKEGLFMAWLGTIIDKAYDEINSQNSSDTPPIEKLNHFIEYKLKYFEKNKITIQGYLKNNQLFLKGISRRKENVMDKVYIEVSKIINEILNNLNDYYLEAYILDNIINSYIECAKVTSDNLKEIQAEILNKFLNMLGANK